MVLFEQSMRDLEYRRGVREAFSQFVDMQEFAAVENENIYNEIIDEVKGILEGASYKPNEDQTEKLKFWLDARTESVKNE